MALSPDACRDSQLTLCQVLVCFRSCAKLLCVLSCLILPVSPLDASRWTHVKFPIFNCFLIDKNGNFMWHNLIWMGFCQWNQRDWGLAQGIPGRNAGVDRQGEAFIFRKHEWVKRRKSWNRASVPACLPLDQQTVRAEEAKGPGAQ